jgi:hypothetical protein
MNAGRELEIANVLAHRLRIIAYAIRRIEAGIHSVTFAAATAHEAVQQAVVLVPLGHFVMIYIHGGIIVS